MTCAEPLIYLFGIARTGKHQGNHGGAKTVGTVKFSGLRNISEGDLCSIVSDLHLPEGTELNSLLECPEQAEALVLHHHGVLKQECAQTEVLPLRFGAVFRNEGSLREVLAKGQQQYLETLAELEDSIEWGVKVYCDRATFQNFVKSQSPRITAVQTELKNASKGKEFFLRRKQQKLLEEETDLILYKSTSDLLTKLKSFAKKHAVGKVNRASVHEGGKNLICNDAFLVERTQKDNFHQEINKLNEECVALGIKLEITGPWPSYSFASSKLDGGKHDT